VFVVTPYARREPRIVPGSGMENDPIPRHPRSRN